MIKFIITGVLALLCTTSYAQRMPLPAVMDSIAANHPVVKMYNAEIRSMDAAAKGARSWMPPTVGAGFFMTPYNAKLWQRDGDMLGMGSVAVSVEQMFPNRKKLNANENLMKAMSSVEKEKLYAALNENFQDAKKYPDANHHPSVQNQCLSPAQEFRCNFPKQFPRYRLRS